MLKPPSRTSSRSASGSRSISLALAKKEELTLAQLKKKQVVAGTVTERKFV